MTGANLGLIELAEPQIDLVQEYGYVQAQIKKLEERSEELKVALMRELRDTDGGTIGGALVVRRIQATGFEKLDSKALERRYPDVYQSCLKWVQPRPYIRLVNG